MEDLVNIKVAMGKFEEKLEFTNETVNRIEDKLDAFIKCSKRKFARRWVEKVLVWGGSIIGGAILLALMRLVLIK